MGQDTEFVSLVQEKDIERVLARFEEEYDKSLIRNKFALDTSTATIDETLAEFAREIKPHLAGGSDGSI